MQAATPTIKAEELAKRLADPETAAGGYSNATPTVVQPAVPERSPQGSETSSCADTPKWRETCAAREEEEEDALEREYGASEITKQITFTSPAKTIFTHKVESGVASRRLEQAALTSTTSA